MKEYGFEGGMVGIIGVAIAILVFAGVIPTVGTATVAVAGNGSGIAGYGNSNVSGASNSLTQLFPLLFIAVGIVKFAGLI